MPEGPSSQEHMTPSKQRKEEKQGPFAVIKGDSIALQKEQSKAHIKVPMAVWCTQDLQILSCVPTVGI